MFQVQILTADAVQQQNLILPDGTITSLTIMYSPQQQGWFIVELDYGTFILQGVRITNSPNILFQFKNQLPFGLACFSTENREPTQQEDFFSGEAVLYILNSSEVQEYANYLQGKGL